MQKPLESAKLLRAGRVLTAYDYLLVFKDGKFLEIASNGFKWGLTWKQVLRHLKTGFYYGSF